MKIMSKRLTAVLIFGGLMMFAGTRVWAQGFDMAALEEEYPVLKAFKGVKMEGFVDVGINYNFNKPDSRSNSDLRVFDRRTDSFTLNMVEIAFEKPVEDDGYIGYRFDLDFGKDANITAPADTDALDEFDLEQGFISLRAPVGNGIDFQVGKFVTLLGAEVIEAPLNYNYSRSFLFGLAIPFTHTGVLGTYAFNDVVSLSAGVVNGWDVIEDNNDAKTFLGNVSFAPADYFSIGVNGVWGAEQDNNDSSKRSVIDIVTTIQPLEELTFVVNLDYGKEEDAVSAGSNAEWSGVAGYVHYEPAELDWLGLTLRSEFFNDGDGARTGTAQELWEVTLTSEFKVSEGAFVRVEFRHDESNKQPFTDRNGDAADNQDTIALEFAYIF